MKKSEILKIIKNKPVEEKYILHYAELKLDSNIIKYEFNERKSLVDMIQICLFGNDPKNEKVYLFAVDEYDEVIVTESIELIKQLIQSVNRFDTPITTICKNMKVMKPLIQLH